MKNLKMKSGRTRWKEIDDESQKGWGKPSFSSKVSGNSRSYSKKRKKRLKLEDPSQASQAQGDSGD